MIVRPLKGIFKPDRGYVCLSCLLKQGDGRFRSRNIRFQSTVTQSTSSLVADSGFAAVDVAWIRPQDEPSKDASPPKSNTGDRKPNTQRTAKAAVKKVKGSDRNVKPKGSKTPGAGLESKPAKKKKKKGKNDSPPQAVAADAMANAVEVTKESTGNGEASSSKPANKKKKKKKGKNDSPPQAAAADAMANALEVTKESTENGESSSLLSGDAAARNSATPKSSRARVHGATSRQKKSSTNKAVLSKSPVRQKWVRIYASIGREAESDGKFKQDEVIPATEKGDSISQTIKNPSSATTAQRPRTQTIRAVLSSSLIGKNEEGNATSVAMQLKRALGERGSRSIAEVAELWKDASKEKRKAIEEEMDTIAKRVDEAEKRKEALNLRRLERKQKILVLKEALEASVGAQKETLKANDKAEKILEAKAQIVKKVFSKLSATYTRKVRTVVALRGSPKSFIRKARSSSPESSGEASHSDGNTSLVEALHGSLEAPARKVLSRFTESSKSISQLDGNMSLGEALKAQSNGELKHAINSEIHQIEAEDLFIAPVEVAQPPVPGLSYGLERVLFNPGVYHIQDPRSRVFNFDPYLQTIMPVAEFDFNALKQYITSSRDKSLQAIAQAHDKRYVGSSSSMTGILAHFHFLLSQWRPINSSMMSQGFPDQLRSFTALQRCPSAIFLRWKNGTYAIDADKEYDTANILSMLGKSMEKLLTLPTEDYERYRKTSSGQVSDEERNSPESFHYCTMGDFLMRSQLDAYDARLPGTGMFDLKTRAVVAIRMDAKNYQEGVGYQIKTRQGEYESFEREYFDMIRSAFLKYSLQVRMGRMDGIFVAFHNTERIFGFQYVSLQEMDLCLHGQWETRLGDEEFKLSLSLLNKLLDRATEKFPEQSLRIHFEARDVKTPFMYMFAEPVTEEQVQEIQTKNKSKIEEFERKILGLHNEEGEAASAEREEETEDDASKWEDIQAKVEEELNSDELSTATATTTHESPLGDVALNDAGAGEPPDGSDSTDLGPLFASKTLYEGSEQSAASAADLEEEEEDDEGEEDEDGDEDQDDKDGDDEDEDKDDEDEDGGDEDEDEEDEDLGEDKKNESSVEEAERQSNDDDVVKNTDVEVNTEANTNEIVEELENVQAETEGDSESKPSEDIMTSETQASEEISEVPQSEVEQVASDHTQEGSSSNAEAQVEAAEAGKGQAGAEGEQFTPLLAMTLTIRNKVNNRYVTRAEELRPSDKWTVEYSLAEIATASRAWSLYGACQMRRKKKLDDEDREEEDVAQNYYLRRLRELSTRGRKWRDEQDEAERRAGKVVLDQSSHTTRTAANDHRKHE